MGVTKGTVLARGVCPACFQDRPLNTDGTLKGHGGCPGEHDAPPVTTAMTAPTPEALARTCRDITATCPHLPSEAACAPCIALALTEQAREIERATWEAAAVNAERDACVRRCMHDHCGWLKKAAARARVAAQGGAL